MAKPFNEMPSYLRDSTCKELSDAGWTEDHAAWLRKPGHALSARFWIEEQMAAEQTTTEMPKEEFVELELNDDPAECSVVRFKCPFCRRKYAIKTDPVLDATKDGGALRLLCRCDRVIVIRRRKHPEF